MILADFLAARPPKIPCSYPGCTRAGLLEHEMCDYHRGYHRNRNKRWKRLRAMRKQQMVLGLETR